MRRWLAAVLVTALLASCSSDPWPFPAQVPPCCAQHSPADIGETIPAVVLFIPARPGQRLELLGAEPIGELDGATVELFASPPAQQPDGSVLIGESRQPIAGTVLEAAEAVASGTAPYTIGIVAEVTPSGPGRFVVSGLRLTYRVNGDERVGEGIETVFTVCADDPEPSIDDCQPADD